MKIRDIALCITVSALTACSGGGGGNNDDNGSNNGNNTGGNNNGDNGNNNPGGVGLGTQATLSTDNSKDAGLMASAAAKQAIANQTAPDLPSAPFKTSQSLKSGVSDQSNLTEFATTAPDACSSGSISRSSSKTTFDNCALASACASGSFVVNGTATGLDKAWDGDLLLTWNDCALGATSTIFDGTEHIVKTNGGDNQTVTYDITVKSPGLEQTHRTRTKEICTGALGENKQCETTTTFDDFGQTYSLSQTDISGDSSSGYTVSTRVASDALGYINVTTTQPLLFSCDNGWASTGVIQITAFGGAFETVTFTSCTSFTVTYNGVAVSYDWSQF